MRGFSKLIVVSSAGWLAKDFRAPGIIEVQSEIGFDLPRSDLSTTAWWCSGSYAARAAATGLVLPLISAGPHWLPSIPYEWRKREVTSMRLADIDECFHGGFIKPAEIKIGTLPARLYSGTADLLPWQEYRRDAENAHLPEESWLNVSEPMDYRREYRCFTAYGKVTAVTPYLINEVTWDGMEPDAEQDGRTAAGEFVQEFLDAIGPDSHPPGFTVDAGLDANGEWSVIEANASWSSNPYHADMSGVIESVLASHDINGEFPQWAWSIDPYHHRNARPLHWREQ